MARVLLYSDEPVLAHGFLTVAGGFPGLERCGVCQSPAELVERALAEDRPDVLLIDLTPEVTFGLLTQLRRELPLCRIVLWVRTISTELAYQAMELGIRGILRKTLPAELLVKCLAKVSEGELWFDKGLTASFLSAKMVTLTRRESQLVSLLSQGLKNKEIATTLSISEGTVKVYLSRLFQKVGVKDRFELALYGLRNLQNMSREPGASHPGLEAEGARGPAGSQWLRSLVVERHSERIPDQLSLWGPRT
ncbi:MAG: response regulator transcription factor [Acidobacteria bacterium]|nr:response regulator transcription factor [Acidobacteriota bacterium]